MLIHRTPVGQIIHTPAKINLFFEITGRRDDGFHEVETLMAPIGLYDTLRVRPNLDGQIRLRCRLALGELGSEKDNLIVRAVSLLRKYACVDVGADIELTKRIPIAAGLGGGSSDAAAALVAANNLWKLKWPRSRLAEVAAELGSDVPFFLYGKAAVCRGRGEIIDPVDSSLSCPVVVLCPPVGLSTAEVFATYRSTPRSDENLEAIAPFLDAFVKGQVSRVGKSLFNRLESVATGLCPWIDRMAYALEQEEGFGHQMSGSGSCYFGLFHTWKQAQRVASRLQSKQLGIAYVVQMCQHSNLC